MPSMGKGEPAEPMMDEPTRIHALPWREIAQSIAECERADGRALTLSLHEVDGTWIASAVEVDGAATLIQPIGAEFISRGSAQRAAEAYAKQWTAGAEGAHGDGEISP